MQCNLCKKSIDPHSPTSWKQVTGWVGGAKKDSMRLREDTGEFAHDLCIKAQMQGTPAGQPSLFDEVGVGAPNEDEEELNLE